MEKRGYHPNSIWRYATYRGKELGGDWPEDKWEVQCWRWIKENNNPIYPEHNDEYLKECLENLKNKGIEINDT